MASKTEINIISETNLLLTKLFSGCSLSPLLEVELLSSSSASELLARMSSSEWPSSRVATSSSTKLQWSHRKLGSGEKSRTQQYTEAAVSLLSSPLNEKKEINSVVYGNKDTCVSTYVPGGIIKRTHRRGRT